MVHRQTVIDPVPCPPVSTSPRVAPDAAAVPSPAVKRRLRPAGIVAGAKAPPAVLGADGRIGTGSAGGQRMGSSGSHDPDARADDVTSGVTPSVGIDPNDRSGAVCRSRDLDSNGRVDTFMWLELTD